MVKSEGLRTMTRRRGILIFAATALWACQRAGQSQENTNQAPKPSAKKAEISPEPGWEKFTSSHYPYEIYLPSGWSLVPDSEISPAYKNTDILVNNIHPKFSNGQEIEDAYTEGAMIWAQPLPAGKDLDTFIREQRGRLDIDIRNSSDFETEAIKDGQIWEYRFNRTGGYPEFLARLNFLGPSVFHGPLAVEVDFLKDGKVWTMLFGSGEDFPHDGTEKFRKIAETFRFAK